MHRYRARAVAVLMALTLGVTAAAFQAPRTPAPRLAPPANGAGNVSIKVAQMTTPVKGQAYQFSLCAGQPLAAGVASTVCHAADATGVSGATGNSIVSFKLQNGSFLPPGLHLDGNGVITGTTTADLSKVTVKICAFQIGGFGSNFNCQGQTLGFNGGKVVVLNTPPAAPPAAPAAAGGGGPGLGTALGLGAAGAAGIGAYTYLKSAGPDCSSQLAAIGTAANGLSSCGTSTSCFNNVVNRIISAAGAVCTCLGSTPLDASDKAYVADLLRQLAQFTSVGNLPACYR